MKILLISGIIFFSVPMKNAICYEPNPIHAEAIETVNFDSTKIDSTIGITKAKISGAQIIWTLIITAVIATGMAYYAFSTPIY